MEEQNLTTLAVAIGRVETLTLGISQQLSEFKINHREDLSFVWKEMEAHGARITNLENINLERKGGKISIRTALEVVVGGFTLYFYYLMAIHK